MQKHDWKVEFRREEAKEWIVRKGGDKKIKEMVLLAMFVGWRERCSKIFSDKSKTLLELIQEVEDMWKVHH